MHTVLTLGYAELPERECQNLSNNIYYKKNYLFLILVGFVTRDLRIWAVFHWSFGTLVTPVGSSMVNWYGPVYFK